MKNNRTAPSVWLAWVIVTALLAGCQFPLGQGTPSTQDPASTQVGLSPDTGTATQTVSAGGPAPASQNLPLTPASARQALTAQNAANLQVVGQVAQNGAQFFSWLGDGQAAALAAENGLSIYLLERAVVARQVSTAPLALLASSPDQTALAWADKANQIHYLATASVAELQAAEALTATVTGLAVAPGGDRLAASTFKNTLHIFNAHDGSLLDSVSLPYWLANLAYSPDGRWLAAADLPNFTIHFFDAASIKEVRTLTWTESASPALYGVYFSPDWKSVAWAARGAVQLMDVDTGKLGPTLLHEDFVNGVAWDADGTLLGVASNTLVNGAPTPVVLIWDTASGQELNTLLQPSPVIGLSFSSSGKELGTLNADGALRLWGVTK